MKKLMVLLMALVMVLSLAACGQSGSEEEIESKAQESTEGSGTEDAGGDGTKEFTVGLRWMAGNLDPAISWNGWTLAGVGVGENLVQFDENGSLWGVLAESFERVDDHTVVFEIREGAYFHNGKAVDAAAAKASIERALAMEEREDVKFPVDEIMADGMTLTIKTSEPFATLVNNLADPYYVIIDTDATEEEIKSKPICTGAFKVVGFTPDQGMELVKHDQHWSGDIQVDAVHVVYMPDATTRSMALQSGDIDMAQGLPHKDLALFEADENYSVQAGPTLRVTFIRPNMTKPYMQDLALRQAIHYGMDTKVYAENIVGTEMANGPFYKALPFGETREMPYPYDPEKAKALLDEAGYVDTNGDGYREYDGQNLKLVYLDGADAGDDANIAAAIQAQLGEIGLEVELMLVENATELMEAGQFDLYADGWTAAPTGDPEYFLRASYKTDGYGNIGMYSSEKMDAYIDGLSTLMDVQDRYDLGREATRYMVEDVASYFLYYQEGSAVMDSNIHGVPRFMSSIQKFDHRISMD